MPVDPNDVAAHLRATTNVRYLLHVKLLITERIKELGGNPEQQADVMQKAFAADAHAPEARVAREGTLAVPRTPSPVPEAPVSTEQPAAPERASS